MGHKEVNDTDSTATILGSTISVIFLDGRWT